MLGDRIRQKIQRFPQRAVSRDFIVTSETTVSGYIRIQYGNKALLEFSRHFEG
jgi:hypothetical protein